MITNTRKTVFWSIIIAAVIIVLLSVYFVKSSHLKYKEDSPVLYFNFDEAPSEGVIYDLSGKENTGVVSGAVWRAQEGKFGNGAMYFDGLDDAITVNDSIYITPATTKEMTIALWIKPFKGSFIGEGSERDYIHFLGKGGQGNDYEYVFRQYNYSNAENKGNWISFYIFNLSGGYGLGSSYADQINFNEWIFLTGVFNGTHVQLWKNGVLRDARPISQYGIKPEQGTAPLKIGTADNDSYYTGYIDEVRIYNRALNQKEISGLFNHNNESA